MKTLPKPMTIDEAMKKADYEFAACMEDAEFRAALMTKGVGANFANKIFRIGFMAGGQAATQQIQDYVDAGGELEPSPPTSPAASSPQS